MGEFLIYEQTGAVVTLIMNNPEKRNALGGDYQANDFTDACQRINANMDVKAVILTGAGKAFSAGGDIFAMRDKTGPSAGTPVNIRNNYRTGIQRIPLAFYNLEVPTIAAVNGAAIGAGCDLSMMCDMRIASEYAKFAQSFVKLGIIPGDGGAWFLPRVVGMSCRQTSAMHPLPRTVLVLNPKVELHDLHLALDMLGERSLKQASVIGVYALGPVFDGADVGQSVEA